MPVTRPPALPRNGARILAAATGLLALLAAGSAAAEPPRVVASIKPVHSLAAAVMEGIGAPHLLVGGSSSPHTYSLRPSDARALSQAHVVIRVGEGLETFLDRPLSTLSGGARVLELIEEPGMTLRPLREGGVWEAHDHGHGAHGHDDGHAHGHGHDHGHGHGHDHGHDHDGDHDHAAGTMDAHVWLDVGNARTMAAAIARTLAEADPANAAAYEANAEALSVRLDALDADLRERLSGVADRPFVVFHDAYGYLEGRYGLNAVGAITVNPEQPPSARRLSEIRARLNELDAVCIFAEPQFEPAVVRSIAEGTRARSGVLDPLGADVADGPDLYFEVMRRLAGSLADCLDPASGR